MNDDDYKENNNNYLKPKIITLKSNNDSKIELTDFSEHDLDFPISLDSFKPNQRVNIEIFDEHLLEITVLQSNSTPGIIMKEKIRVKPGKYIFTVVGYSEYGRTFFPWVRDTKTKSRISETIHLSENEEPISVHFSIKETCIIELGVLSHRQEIGDKCYLRSLHITKDNNSSNIIEKENPYVIDFNDLIPHHETRIKVSNDGLVVKSSSYSTPGSYVLLDAKGIDILSISVTACIKYPSTAFLYVADAVSGEEFTRRNYILESNIEGKDVDLLTAVKLPKDTNKIRLGVLFSKTTSNYGHEMILKKMEAIEYRSLNDFVDKTYVLNLEEDKDKFLICSRQSDRFGLDITRWVAEDGSDEINYRDWEQYLKRPWTEQDKILNRKSIDKPGAWGYLLTMKSIFLDAIKNNYQSILVFDDDFILSKYFDHDFSKFINSVPKNWSVLYLGASQWSWDSVVFDKKIYYQANLDTNGSFAVIYKKEIFRKLILSIEKMNSPFDAGPLRELVLSEKNTSFVSFPNLVIANIQKEGIRGTRDQEEYSKRFRWNLDDFPSNFLSWSPEPVILRDESNYSTDQNKKHFVTAVTTLNRIDYLKNFIKGWNNTRDKTINHTLIIADDGSSDGTLSWITQDLFIEDVRIIIILNDGTGIARQSNSIIHRINQLNFTPDLIFMCNDDINFVKEDWDKKYHNSVIKSGYGHLVYFNTDWKASKHDLHSEEFSFLHSSCSAMDAMGCFYTLTPEIIRKIGFFDEKSFPIRGHSHIDYTMRICKINGNNAANIFDMKNSNEYISMFLKDEYVRTYKTLSVKEILSLSSKEELDRRLDIIKSDDRLYIEKGW